MANPSVQAPHGQRGIQVVVDFWTDGIAPEGRGHILPKTGWQAGAVSMRARKAHGIAAGEAIPFNSIDELTDVIKRAISRAGVELQPMPSRRVS